MNNFEGIRLKQIGGRGKIKIWVVDGNLIRSTIDKEFTNFGQHFRFSFIPKYEFWIDKTDTTGEYSFFIDHLLVEWGLMEKGMSYSKALEMADIKEKSERVRSRVFLRALTKRGTPNLSKIHIEIIKRLNNSLRVWRVNGRLVRSLYDIDFVEGGHDLVYNFVPNKEVWIDSEVLSREEPYIILHELYERKKMKEGFTYNQAHSFASRIEWKARHDSATLKERLDELGW